MNFLLDANLPRSAAVAFESHGEVWHAQDIGLGSAPDQEVAAAALEKHAILVTRDLGFSNPHLFPSGSHVGLVIVRVPSFFMASEIVDLLKWLVRSTDNIEDLEGKVTVVELSRIRRRPL